MSRWLLAAIAVVVGGCGIDQKADVQSNTSWSGAFGNRTVDGSGSRTVDLPDDEIVCVVVQKETRDGYLKVRVRTERSLMWDSETDWVETSAEFGVVTACSD